MYSTIIVLVVALVAFAADLAVGRGRKRARRRKPRRTSLGRQVSGGRSTARPLTVAAVRCRRQRWARVGVSLTTLAAALAVGAVVTRGHLGGTTTVGQHVRVHGHVGGGPAGDLGGDAADAGRSGATSVSSSCSSTCCCSASRCWCSIPSPPSSSRRSSRTGSGFM